MKHLLDTSTVIYLLQGAAIGRATADDEVSISVITEIELLGWNGISEEEEAAVRQFLKIATIHPLNDEVKESAIALRRAARLKTPDAIIAATAQVTRSVLVTSDERLLKVPGLTSRRPGEVKN